MGCVFVPEQDNIGSAAPGHYGVAASTLLTLQETPIAVAWNLQGDAADPAFAEQVQRAFGLTRLPETNATHTTDRLTAFWLGPTSWLLLAGEVPGTYALTAFAAQRDAVNLVGGALFDVSASRIAWKLSGPRAATVLASGCPLDLHPRVFPAGSCAQSLFGHVGVLVGRDAQGDFSLLVARSLARDVWQTLCATGAQYGYEVLAPVPFR